MSNIAEMLEDLEMIEIIENIMLKRQIKKGVKFFIKNCGAKKYSEQISLLKDETRFLKEAIKSINDNTPLENTDEAVFLGAILENMAEGSVSKKEALKHIHITINSISEQIETLQLLEGSQK